jgi:DNA-binding IscR family transcriptional regulator
MAVEDIAADGRVPAELLPAILSDLTAAGIVKPADARDVYSLDRAPADISLGDLLRSIQGPGYTHTCLDPEREMECASRASCMLRPIWQSEYDLVRRRYDSTTFQDLARRGLAAPGSGRGLLA